MVEIEYRHESIKRSADAIRYIHQEWNKAKNQDSLMFAGNLAAVTGYTTSDKRIWINTIHTTYDDFFVSKTDEFLEQFPYEIPANPLSVGIVLVTNDDKIPFGIRSKRMALQKNTATIPSGMVDENDLSNNNRIDCFNTVQRETFEETGIPEYCLSEICCMGLVWNKSHKQTYLPFYGRTNLDSDEITKIFDDKCREFSRMMFLPNSLPGIYDAMNLEPISDIVKPTLEIYAGLFEKLNLAKPKTDT